MIITYALYILWIVDYLVGDPIVTWETLYLTSVKSETPTPKGRGLILETEDGKRILLTKRSLKQYANIGIPCKIRAKKEGDLYYVAWLSSEEFCPITHRELFDFVENTITNAGVRIMSKKLMKWFKRTGMYFKIDEIPLEYARQGDYLGVGILVTNANTTQDSIRIYPYNEILKCKNGLITRQSLQKYWIAHRGNKEDVLRKVNDSILDCLSGLYQESEKLSKDLRFLGHTIFRSSFKDEIDKMIDLLPLYVRSRFIFEKENSEREFGDTPLTYVQALSRLSTDDEIGESTKIEIIRIYNKIIEEVM